MTFPLLFCSPLPQNRILYHFPIQLSNLFASLRFSQSYFLKKLFRCSAELYGKETQCLLKVSQTKGFMLFAKSNF